MRQLLIVSVAFCLGMPPSEASGSQPPRLSDAVTAYQSQQFDRSISILSEIIRLSPADPQARYLLANSFMALGKISDADREYTACLRLNPTEALRNQCQKGLQLARMYAAVSQSPSAPSMSSAAPADQKGTLKMNEKQIAAESNALKARAIATHDRLVKSYRRQAEERISGINKASDAELAHTPPVIYTGVRVYGQPMAIENPEYKLEKERLRAATDRSVAKVESELKEKITAADLELKRTLADLDAQLGVLTSQATSGKGDIQLMPAGSGLFVRNYVNFGDTTTPPPVPPVELRAKPRSFEDR